MQLLPPEEEIQRLLAFVSANLASDLHLKVGYPPTIRIGGHLRRVDSPELPDSEYPLTLSTGRTLWRRRSGPCWIATQAYGEGATELDALRTFRDEVLLPTRMGRVAVACYDRCSPGMVRWLEHRPRTRAWVRRGLDVLVRRIA